MEKIGNVGDSSREVWKERSGHYCKCGDGNRANSIQNSIISIKKCALQFRLVIIVLFMYKLKINGPNFDP